MLLTALGGKILLRLNNDNTNSLLKETLYLSKILDKEGLYSWFTYMLKI
jgi:hypothetical protein